MITLPCLCCLRQGAGAVPAFARVDRDFHLALRTFLRCRIGWDFAALYASDECVHRSDYEVVDCGSDEQERNQGVEKKAVRNVGAVDGEHEGREIWLADNRGEQR